MPGSAVAKVSYPTGPRPGRTFSALLWLVQQLPWEMNKTYGRVVVAVISTGSGYWLELGYPESRRIHRPPKFWVGGQCMAGSAKQKASLSTSVVHRLKVERLAGYSPVRFS